MLDAPLPASVKQVNCSNTGDTFRSYDLRVMSPARFLCATPVCNPSFTRRGGGVKGEGWEGMCELGEIGVLQ